MNEKVRDSVILPDLKNGIRKILVSVFFINFIIALSIFCYFVIRITSYEGITFNEAFFKRWIDVLLILISYPLIVSLFSSIFSLIFYLSLINKDKLKIILNHEGISYVGGNKINFIPWNLYMGYKLTLFGPILQNNNLLKIPNIFNKIELDKKILEYKKS